MPIRYRCPECGQLLSIGTRMAGRDVDCPHCNAYHTVPEADAENAIAAAPPTQPAPEADAPSQTVTSHQRPWSDDEEEDDDGFGFTVSHTERPNDEVDLIPMVDCIFLLLVFYMLTSAFGVEKMLGIPAPDSGKGRQRVAQSSPSLDDLKSSSVTARIDGSNAIYIEDQRIDDPAHLVEALHSKLLGSHKSELLLEVSENAYHENVVAVVDAATEAQFQRVRLSTLPDNESQ